MTEGPENRADQEELADALARVESCKAETQALRMELAAAKQELDTLRRTQPLLVQEIESLRGELVRRTDELAVTKNDIHALSASAQIAALLLDPALRLAQFTAPAATLLRLQPADVGRPLQAPAAHFAGEDLVALAEQVQRRLTPIERQVRDAAGVWFVLRLLPYCALANQAASVAITLVDISALKRAEEELRDSEATMRGILNAARESIWLFGADGKVLSGNETALQRWGAPAESIIGKNILDVLPGDLGESRMACVRATVASAAPVALDDERAGFAFEHRFYPVVGSAGRVERVAVFSRDVTNRKRADNERERLLAELQQRTAELDAILVSMVDGMVVYGADGQRTFANQAADSILHYTSEEQATTDLAVRTRLMSFLAEDGTPLAPEQAPAAKALRGEASRRVILRVPRPEGEVWISVSASPIRGPDGAIRGAVSTVRNITQSKQIDSRMTWLASFPQRNPLPITEVSLSGVLHFVNPSARRMFPELERQGLLHPWLSDWQAVVEALRARPGFVSEREIRVADRHYHQSLQLLPEVDRIRIYGRDITERRRVEESLFKVNQQLREADLHKNQFLAMLSHELRNPLAPIRNSLHTLGRVPPDSETGRRALAIIERQTRHMTKLVDDLLDIARISRGKIQLRRRPLELGGVVRRSAEDLRELFVEKGIALELALSETALWVDGDATRLAQTVGNLLHNTLKFTSRGGRVWVMLAVSDGRAALRVRDTGVGMSDDMLAKLFQPFSQAERTLDRSNGGLGLGLVLVKSLVELHGGEVHAHSEGLGQGAEFVVHLPVIPAPPLIPEDAPVSPGAPPRQRVLVIEDNVDAALSLCEVLELGGHEVAVAYQGAEGLAKAAELRPDIVLCDIGLPGMDGYEVARRLRADPAMAGVSLVALSGYALPEDLERAAAAGFDRHIAKPPSLEQIEELLGSLR
jgi:PAS domain S-box-containing protein